MYRRFLIALLLLGVVAVGFAAVPGRVSSQSDPDERFGVVEGFWVPDEAAELRLGWERILFYWREIQPSGPDDWNTLHVREEWLTEAAAQGRSIIGVLKNTPSWASEDGSEAGLPKGLSLPIEDPGNLWANFLRQVAAYYGERGVHDWVIWNEPEIKPGIYGFEFAGSVQDYVRLLKVSHLVLKEVDPEAVVHLAGLTWWHDPTYLDRLLEELASDPEAPQHDYYFDTISLHIYFRSETVGTIVQAVQDIQKAHGLNKPIWINETNAAPNQDPLWPVERPAFEVDLEQQAWYIVQAYALGFAAGASHIGVYKLVDVQLPPGAESFGLLRPDLTRRPAFDAYKTTITHLGGFAGAFDQENRDFHAVTFTFHEKTTRVLWARTATSVTLRVPALANSGLLVESSGQTNYLLAGDNGYVLELVGARCNDECLIGGPPLFLIENSTKPFVGKPPHINETDDPLSPILQLPTATSEPTLIPTSTSTPLPSATLTQMPTTTPLATVTVTPEPIPSLTASPPVQTVQPTASADPGLPVTQSPNDLQDLTGLFFIGSGLGLILAFLLLIRQRHIS